MIRFLPFFALGLLTPAALAQDDEDFLREEEFREYLSPEYRELLDGRGFLTDRLKVSGSAKSEFGYDDNVLLDEQDRESDMITTLVPSILAVFEHDRFLVNGQYRAPYRLFADHSEFDGVEHFADGHARYLGDPFRAHVWSTYQRLREPYDAVIFRDRVERQQSDAGTTLGLIFNRLEFEAALAMRRFDVLEDELDQHDNRRLDLALRGGVRFTRKTTALIEAGRGRITYDDTDAFNNFDLEWLLAGVRGELTEALVVDLKVGPFQVNVRDGQDHLAPNEDQDEIMVRGRIVWHASQTQILTIELERIPVETLTDGWALYSRVRAGFDHWLAERVQAGVVAYYEHSEEAGQGPESAAIGAIGTAKYEIARNFVVDGRIEVRRIEDDEEDTTANVRGSLGVALVW